LFENIPTTDRGTGKFHRNTKSGSWQENFSFDEQELMTQIMEKISNLSNTINTRIFTIIGKLYVT
jgi:hypothetical protein